MNDYSHKDKHIEHWTRTNFIHINNNNRKIHEVNTPHMLFLF